jgi:sterol desaturase/sphingolipid hydroxylase (fatty acid hydroxylase superfamily)
VKTSFILDPEPSYRRAPSARRFTAARSTLIRFLDTQVMIALLIVLPQAVTSRTLRALPRRKSRKEPNMPSAAPIVSSIAYVGVILAVMAVVAWIETIVPLHARGRWNRDHLGPNLALTFITFGTNVILNGALVATLVWLSSEGFGLLPGLPLSPWIAGAVAVLALDLATYVAHVSMHKVPAWWRFHRVHHSDPAVDVTTTVRQHPGESLIRYAFLALFAIGLGVGPGAFAVYRAWSALNGLLEHANLRVPRTLDALLSLIVVTPNMHKVHHSRASEHTDTNYGNVSSLFDRLFRTFTPSERGLDVVYGLDGLDDPAVQTTAGLLAMPFRPSRRPVRVAAEV